jgi:hypothetical protein
MIPTAYTGRATHYLGDSSMAKPAPTDARRNTLLAAVLLVAAIAGAPVHAPANAAPTENVPRAQCGPGDRAETDLQGRVPPIERASGFAGYDCNVDLIGQYTGQGAGIQLAAYKNCAYYHSANDQDDAGVQVVDVSNPTNPVATAFLTAPAMTDPWESLKVEPSRGLLAAVQSNDEGFAIYDVRRDCTRPELLATIAVPGGSGHAGNFAADGRTYYGAGFNGSIYAIDVVHPRNPVLVHMFDPPGGIHDLSTNADGTLLYVADSGRVSGVRSAQNGLVIMDVSAIDARLPDPAPSVVTDLYWDDGAIAQMTQLVRINNKPYMVMTDENGSGGLQGWSQACAAGLPPFGFARLIDMSDPSAPTIVSKLRLEVHDPQNCPVVLADTGATAIFSYDSHYCSVDDPRDAKLLACSYFESGLRVFDIRDPAHPTEVAYYNPPAGRGGQPGGASYIGIGAVQWNLSTPQIRLRDCQIWTTTTHSGLQVLQLTQKAWPACPAATTLRALAPPVAAVGTSPLDAFLVGGRSVGVGAGYCVIPEASFS